MSGIWIHDLRFKRLLKVSKIFITFNVYGLYHYSISSVYSIWHCIRALNENFSNILFFQKSDLNETFNQSLTDLYLINCLTI